MKTLGAVDRRLVLKDRLSFAISYCVPRWDALLKHAGGETCSAQVVASSVIEIVCCLLYVGSTLDMYSDDELFLSDSYEYEALLRVCVLFAEHVCADAGGQQWLCWATDGVYSKSFRVYNRGNLPRRRGRALSALDGLGLSMQEKSSSSLCFVSLSQRFMSLGQEAIQDVGDVSRYEIQHGYVIGYDIGGEVRVCLWPASVRNIDPRGSEGMIALGLELSDATIAFTFSTDDPGFLEEEVKVFCDRDAGMIGDGLQ